MEKLTEITIILFFISIAILLFVFIFNINYLWAYLKKNNIEKLKSIFDTDNIDVIFIPNEKAFEYIFCRSDGDDIERRIKKRISLSLRLIGIAFLLLVIFLLVFFSLVG